jgi:uncharacterized membrane protein YphA (DoxX/SURF4 family)
MQEENRTRAIITLVASILVGLTLVVSGSGKLIGFGEVPGQTIEFVGDILPEAWITPGSVYFLFEIFVPYVLPISEMLLGLLLLVGLVPRLVAILCIPLIAAFMTNNIWSISQGLDKFPECVCFGIWETFFGGLTPVQSLVYDISLLVLVIVIIFVHPGRFLASRAWLERLITREPGY